MPHQLDERPRHTIHTRPYRRPAVILAAFGTGSRSGEVAEMFFSRLEQQLKGHDVFQACTSEVIRKRLGLPGPGDVLAEVESRGFREAVVQPLYIFPGNEYLQLKEMCLSFSGLRIIMGETLMHRWYHVREVLEIIKNDFIEEKQGINIIAMHGTSFTADTVNSICLSIADMVSGHYRNVLAASVEGVPDIHSIISRIRQDRISPRHKKIRIIPLMLFAGFHAEKDLMGEKESWRTIFKNMGFDVELPVIKDESNEYFKGLAWYPGIAEMFVSRVHHSLERLPLC